MEWIQEFWYVILLGIIVTMFIFGRRTNTHQDEKADVSQHGTHTEGKTHKSGHGCCH